MTSFFLTFFYLEYTYFYARTTCPGSHLSCARGQTEAVRCLCHALEKSQGEDENCREMKAKWEESEVPFPRPTTGGSREQK